MGALFRNVIIILATSIPLQPGNAQAQQCHQVVMNCTTKPHRLTVDGWNPRNQNLLNIDCGKNTNTQGAIDAVTYPGYGYLGNMIQTTGNAVLGGLDISGIDGMGTCGGVLRGGVNQASIIHTIPSGANPKGGNSSNGCIHVSQEAMNYLAMHCIQAKLQIVTPNRAVPAPRNCTESDPWARGGIDPFGGLFR